MQHDHGSMWRYPTCGKEIFIAIRSLVYRRIGNRTPIDHNMIGIASNRLGPIFALYLEDFSFTERAISLSSLTI